MEKFNAILTGFGSSILGNMLMFLTTIFLTRTVAPDIYGEFRFIFSFISLMVVLFLLGRDSAIIYFSQKNENGQKNIAYDEVSYGLLSLCVGTFILYILGSYVVTFFFNSQVSTYHYQFSLLMIPLWGVVNLLLALLKVKDMVNYSFVFQNLIQRIIRFPFFIFLIFLSPTFYSLALSMITSQCVLLCILIKKLNRNKAIKWIRIQGFFKRLKQSALLGFNTIILVILTKIDVIMVGRYLDNMYVAIYDVCVLLSFVILLPFTALVKSSEPVMQRILKCEREKSTYFKNLKLVIQLSLSMLLFYLIATKEALYIFGQAYSTGALALQVLVVGYTVIIFLGASIEMLNMNGYSRVTSWILLGALVLNILFNWFLIPQYGLFGASLATIASLLVSKILANVMVVKFFNFNLVKIHFSYLLFFPFLFLGMVHTFKSWHLQLGFSIVVSLLFFIVLVFMSKQSRRYLSGLINKF